MTNSNIEIDKAGWSFDNTYAKLPNDLLVNQAPIPVKSPELIILNKDLSKDLNLDFTNIREQSLSQLFSGNLLPTGSTSIAQAYAGHQFGHFTMLGDGRTVLLGEHLVNNYNRFDIQFKGSGKTSFSRNGDGRAALGPMLREYVISEAVHSLNIPTTRSLAVVSTGEKIVRENLLPGAILTRIAASHIRVGTFQYIASKQNLDELNVLVDYTIDRHYPEIKFSKNKALDLLNLVMQKQCQLVVNWMRVGFVHGVMNTDNMTISGETIDYGPCAFIDAYDPKTVFSSIDKFGRYAFSNQPPITKWNLARFAECLIPLINTDENKAIETATDVIDNFQNIYEEKWLNMMRDKLGIFGEDQNDKKMINDLLDWMKKNKVDYTNTFCKLMNVNNTDNKIYQDSTFVNWLKIWRKRTLINNNSKDKSLKLMKNTNPIIIPRNHKVEEALSAANKENFEKVKDLIKILKNPYDDKNKEKSFLSSSTSKIPYKTYCGT